MYARYTTAIPFYYYETIQIIVITSALYSFSISSSSILLKCFLYNKKFNASDILENLVLVDNNFGPNKQFTIETELHISLTYILVMTTFIPRDTGPYSIHISGPNYICFNHISKYLNYRVNTQYYSKSSAGDSPKDGLIIIIGVNQ